MMMAVCWVVGPYSLVKDPRHFRGAFCLHHQRDDGGSTTQNTAIVTQLFIARPKYAKDRLQ
jgi:hypothetical protein